LTAIQAMTSTPFAWKSETSLLNPGKWVAEQVGVKAPGTPKMTAFFPPNNSAVVFAYNPSALMNLRVAAGNLDPTFKAIFL
jgi:hypothetical protein